MSDPTSSPRLDCEEPILAIKGGLAALGMMEDGSDDRRVQRALAFVIAPMEAATRDLEQKLGLAQTGSDDEGKEDGADG